jgi:hypothetical protein
MMRTQLAKRLYAAPIAPIALIALCSCGSAPAPDEPLATASAALVMDNGVELNGIRLNGIRLNGIRLNGIRLNGVALNGIRLNGAELEGTNVDGATLSGSDFVGAEMTGNLSDGSTLALRVDSVVASASQPDVTYYRVSYEGDDGWEPLCGLDDGGDPVWAMPLSGRWDESQGTPTGGDHVADPDTFTLACQGAALAKCVEWGYRPWATHSACKEKQCEWVEVEECSCKEQCKANGKGCQTVCTCNTSLVEQCAPCETQDYDLRGYHQTCTRMVRADFCGDGTPHTVDGMLIKIWDDLDINPWVEGSEWSSHWTPEARWNPVGGIVDHNSVGTLGGRADPCFNLPICTVYGPFGESAMIKTEFAYAGFACWSHY